MILRGIGASGGVGMGPAVCLRGGGAGPRRKRVRRGGGRAGPACGRRPARWSGRPPPWPSGCGSGPGKVSLPSSPARSPCFGTRSWSSSWTGPSRRGETAEAAVDAVFGGYIRLFEGLEDERMRLRAADIRDLQSRLLRALLGRREADLSRLPAGCVLVTRELTPSMAVGLDRERVAAILTETGGSASHAAILTRALGIPAVLGAAGALQAVENGELVLVDGDVGTALPRPGRKEQEEYRTRRAALLRRQARLEPYRRRPTVDGDGRRLRLYANVGHPAEAVRAAAEGAEGIGLLRTEFLFLDRAEPPTEEEQLAAYLAAARPFPRGEVVIRTLDAGGDKRIPWLALPQERNPFLGCRGAPGLLRTAGAVPGPAAGAAAGGGEAPGLRVLLPMATSVSEVRKVRAMLAQCAVELEREGMACRLELPLGVMVETPAAARTADLLAQESDFFSIGTNDLTQYILAADRNAPEAKRLYTPFHPAGFKGTAGCDPGGKAGGDPGGPVRRGGGRSRAASPTVGLGPGGTLRLSGPAAGDQGPHRWLDSRGGRGSGAPGDGSGRAGGDPGLL